MGIGVYVKVYSFDNQDMHYVCLEHYPVKSWEEGKHYLQDRKT